MARYFIDSASRDVAQAVHTYTQVSVYRNHPPYLSGTTSQGWAGDAMSCNSVFMFSVSSLVGRSTQDVSRSGTDSCSSETEVRPEI